MIRHIGIFLGYNLYDTKKHFSIKLSEALNRRGIETTLFNMLEKSPVKLFRSLPRNKFPDMCCSFYFRMGLQACDWTTFQQMFQIPFWNILTDPPLPELKVFSKDSIISCVDHFDCDIFLQNDFKNVFFWGHAVEREVVLDPNQERPYDVVYLGTSYDPDGLVQSWSKFHGHEREVILRAIDLYFNDEKTTYIQAIKKAIEELKVDPTQLELKTLFYHVGSYVKGIDRLELIKSIKDARVYVFGGACFRYQGVKGWQEYFAGSPNVTVHPAVPIETAIEIMKKSKICLNSMPFFKNGTHERLFMGSMCGCLTVNTDTIWVRDHFKEDQDLVLYKPRQWSEINKKVNYYLAHEEERREIAENARQKVIRFHTWDSRAEELLEALKTLNL